LRKWNLLLALLIAAVLIVPGTVVAKIADACCGVDVGDLVVADAPDPACLGDTVTISGTYNTFSPWGPWTELYKTGVDIKVYDSASVMVAEYYLLLGEDLPDPGPEPGTSWSFSQDWTPTAADVYTYTVVAWSDTGYGRMEVSVVGETITVEVCCVGECPTIDPCVEQEIRDRWEAECPACDEAKNHGAYVSCRAKIVSEYVEAGLVDEEGSSCLINPIARTDCGKKKK
jgi:hypothetical protein